MFYIKLRMTVLRARWHECFLKEAEIMAVFGFTFTLHLVALLRNDIQYSIEDRYTKESERQHPVVTAQEMRCPFLACAPSISSSQRSAIATLLGNPRLRYFYVLNVQMSLMPSLFKSASVTLTPLTRLVPGYWSSVIVSIFGPGAWAGNQRSAVDLPCWSANR